MKIALWFLAVASLLARDETTPHIQRAAAAYQAGEIAAQSKHYQDAIEQFRRAIAIEPTFRNAFERLIDTCLASGQRSNAAAAMTQLLEIEPDISKYRLLLGQILLEENQPERALAQFSIVLNREPVNADALFGFAAAARRLGMIDRAAESLEQGRKRYPADVRFKP